MTQQRAVRVLWALAVGAFLGAIFLPKPWADIAAKVEMLVFSCVFAGIVVRFVTDVYWPPKERAQAFQNAVATIAEYQEKIREHDVMAAEYRGWRVRLLDFATALRKDLVTSRMHTAVDQLDPMIRDLSAEVGPQPKTTEVN